MSRQNQDYLKSWVLRRAYRNAKLLRIQKELNELADEINEPFQLMSRKILDLQTDDLPSDFDGEPEREPNDPD